MSNIVYTIVHNGEETRTAAVDTELSAADIKAQCVGIWPELANATVHVDSDRVVTFSMPTGTKQAA